MSELERALRLLGDELEFPETPDVSAAVLRRLREARPRRLRLPARRTLVVAFVVLAVAVGAAMAVPPARTAILEFFGLQGASVRRVETLPPARARPADALELGRPVPVEDGRPRAGVAFVLVPTLLGPPDAAYVSQVVPGGKLSLVYEPRDDVPRSNLTGVGLLVTLFRGDLEPGFIEKFAAGATNVERLTVGGDEALWLEGGPHFVVFRRTDGEIGEEVSRLAGNTLLVQRGSLLVRIEGDIDRGRAVAIAESLEPPG